MLGYYYRLVLYNNTGVSLPANSCTFKGLRWYRSSSTGTQTWEGSPTPTNLVSSGDGSGISAGVSTASYAASAVFTNTNAYEGGTFEFVVDFTSAASTPSGQVTIYLQRSADNSQWPDNGNGTVVCTLSFTAKAPDHDVKEL